MASKIDWTESALQNLGEIATYIAQESPRYASLTVFRIVEKLEMLRDFPRLGRVVPEFTDHKIREIVWRHYRIVYRISDDTVTILTVTHGSQPLPPDLDLT